MLPKFLVVEDIARWSGTSRKFRSGMHSPLPLIWLLEKKNDKGKIVDILSSFGATGSEIAKKCCGAVSNLATEIFESEFGRMGGVRQLSKL